MRIAAGIVTTLWLGCSALAADAGTALPDGRYGLNRLQLVNPSDFRVTRHTSITYTPEGCWVSSSSDESSDQGMVYFHIGDTQLILNKKGGKWLPKTDTVGTDAPGPCTPFYSVTYSLSAQGILIGNVTYGDAACSTATASQSRLASADYELDLEGGTVSISSFENYRVTSIIGGCFGLPYTSDYKASYSGAGAGPVKIIDTGLPGLKWLGPPVDEPVAQLRIVDPQRAALWPRMDPASVANLPPVLGVAADGTSLGVIVFETTGADPVRLSVSLGGLFPFGDFDPANPDAHPGPGVTDLSVSTVLIQGNRRVALAVYKPPDRLGPDVSHLGLSATLDATQGGAQTRARFRLRYPPLLLVHGVWSDGGDWAAFAEFLRLEQYAAIDIELVDYRKYASKSFLDTKIQDLFRVWALITLRSAQAHGFIAKRIDVVGHSMGGLVARGAATAEVGDSNALLRTYGTGTISRLITVGTPHCGSELALQFKEWGPERPGPVWLLKTPLSKFMQSQAKPFDTAVQALSPQSSDLRALSPPAASHLRSWRAVKGIAPAITRLEASLDFLLMSYSYPEPRVSVDSLLDGSHDGHDGVVSAPSQDLTAAGCGLGGSMQATVAVSAVHSPPLLPFVDPKNETKSPDVHGQVLCWLTEQDKSSCPPPPLSSAKRRAAQSKAQVTAVTPADIDFASMTQRPSSAITLTPGSGTDLPAVTESVVAVTSSVASISRVLVIGPDQFDDLTEAPFEIKVTPKTLEQIGLIVIVIFDDNSYASVSASYAVRPPTVTFHGLETIGRVTLEIGTSHSMTATGVYNPGGRLDLTSLATYALSAGAGVVELGPSGLVTALAPGQAVVTTRFGSQVVNTYFRVEPPLSISTGDVSHFEGQTGSTEMSVPVSLSRTSVQAMSVSYATADGTATAGSDYQAVSGVLSVPAGAKTASISVPLVGDEEQELDESFSLSLTNPSSGAVLEHARATAIILNDDGPTPTEQGFFTVSPCRLLDTRVTGSPIRPSADLRLLAAGRCGIPLAAKVIAVNLTITEPSVPGSVVLYSYGLAPPLASSINYAAGQTRANNVIVRLGAGGEIAVKTRQGSGTAELIVDVSGYFE